jgi:hypothetical protein
MFQIRIGCSKSVCRLGFPRNGTFEPILEPILEPIANNFGKVKSVQIQNEITKILGLFERIIYFLKRVFEIRIDVRNQNRVFEIRIGCSKS